MTKRAGQAIAGRSWRNAGPGYSSYQDIIGRLLRNLPGFGRTDQPAQQGPSRFIRIAVVPPERDFVEIGLEIFWLDGASEGFEKDSRYMAGHFLAKRQEILSKFVGGALHLPGEIQGFLQIPAVDINGAGFDR